MVDARKTRIDAQEAWQLLKTASSIHCAKGKKILHFTPLADEKELLLKQVMGPSGNLRAPTYRVGNQFIVGFNLALYED